LQIVFVIDINISISYAQILYIGYPNVQPIIWGTDWYGYVDIDNKTCEVEVSMVIVVKLVIYQAVKIFCISPTSLQYCNEVLYHKAYHQLIRSPEPPLVVIIRCISYRTYTKHTNRYIPNTTSCNRQM